MFIQHTPVDLQASRNIEMDGTKCYMFKVLDINQSHGNWMARTGGTRGRARPKRGSSSRANLNQAREDSGRSFGYCGCASAPGHAGRHASPGDGVAIAGARCVVHWSTSHNNGRGHAELGSAVLGVKRRSTRIAGECGRGFGWPCDQRRQSAAWSSITATADGRIASGI